MQSGRRIFSELNFFARNYNYIFDHFCQGAQVVKNGKKTNSGVLQSLYFLLDNYIIP